MLYDVVFGTFTHRVDNIPKLLASVKKFQPDIPFIVQLADRPILDNFELLRKSFDATKKRFWVFLDDDIEFIQPVLNSCLISMMKNDEPTRAEVTDVFFAIENGADAVMLSDETAKGEHSVETVAMMEKVIRETETHYEGKVNLL